MSRAVTKRILITLALLILAGAAGLALMNPEWVRRHLALKPPADSAAVSTISVADSLQRALEAEASLLVDGQQRAAIAWLREMEAALPPDVTLAAFTAPDAFVLRGFSPSQEALSRLQETLVLVPGMDLRRSEVRPLVHARPRGMARGAVEFLFSGAFTVPQDSSGGPVPNRVLLRADVDAEMSRFLEAAAGAGIAFTSLPAPPPTVSGALRLLPFHLTAPCPPSLLREFLESEYRRDSPLGIQRVLVETAPDSQMVSLDIMAFSR